VLRRSEGSPEAWKQGEHRVIECDENTQDQPGDPSPARADHSQERNQQEEDGQRQRPPFEQPATEPKAVARGFGERPMTRKVSPAHVPRGHATRV